MANGTTSPQNAPIDYTALAKQYGAIDSQPPPATSPSGGIDYTALAAQYGAIHSQPAPAAPAPASSGIDYNALAAQNGAIDSQPAPAAQSQSPDLSSRIWQGVKDSTLGRIVG